MNRLTLTVLAVMTLHTAPGVAAQWETFELLERPKVIAGGAVESLRLPRMTKVEKLIIQAESTSRRGSMFDVMVGDSIKGTVHTPGVDPTYVIEVRESTSSLEFRSLNGGAFRLLKVLVVTEVPTYNLPERTVVPNSNEITSVAFRAIEIVTSLESVSTPEENRSHLLPIKMAAGQAAAVASGHGPYAQKTLDANFVLISMIDAAKSYFDDLSARSTAFDSIVQIWEVRSYLSQITGHYDKNYKN